MEVFGGYQRNEQQLRGVAHPKDGGVRQRCLQLGVGMQSAKEQIDANEAKGDRQKTDDRPPCQGFSARTMLWATTAQVQIRGIIEPND